MAGGRLYVGNLAFELNDGYPTGEMSLIALFEDYGHLVDVVIMRFANGQSRGFGFVEFATYEEATRALALNGIEFHGRALTIEFAKRRSVVCARSSA